MGTYRVTRKLGIGPLFESYVGALRPGPGHPEVPVWLRRLVPPWSQDAGFGERFLPLAESWRGLSSEVASGLVECGSGADSTWVTQALVDGESIRTLLSALSARQQRPQTNEVVAVGIRAAAALRALHEHALSVHHGDVCASTIHLSTTGEVRLTDLGIATAAGSTAQNGPARCEPAALAPEQHHGKYFASTDVYRLGLVLLELVTGRPTPAAAWPGVPEKLATALSWMLAKDPTQRPPARDVESALQVAAEQSGWSVTENDLVRFVARLQPDRTPYTAIPPTGGTELVLKTMPGRELPVTPISGVTLARISTRRITAETLAAEKEKAAIEAAAKVPPPPPWLEMKVGEALVARQKLNAEQLHAAAAQAESLQCSVDDAILSMGLCDEDTVIALEGELTRTPVVSSKRLLEGKVPAEVLARLKPEHAEAWSAVPLAAKAGDQLVIAVRDPLNAEAIEAIKKLTRAASIFAVRAGPAAIARAIGQFYRGVDVEDPSSWLENASGGSVEVATSGAGLQTVAGLELDSSLEGDSMELELRGTLTSPSKSNATLDEPQAALVSAMLVLLGERGRQVNSFITLAAGLTRRLGASETEVAKVRFGAAAIATVNMTAGKAPWEPLKADAVAPVAGSGWRAVHELIGRALDLPRGPPSEVAPLALMTTLVMCAATGSAKPNAQALAVGLQALKARQFLKVVLEAVAKELASVST